MRSVEHVDRGREVTHARGVDQVSAARQIEEARGRRRMTAFLLANQLAHLDVGVRESSSGPAMTCRRPIARRGSRPSPSRGPTARRSPRSRVRSIDAVVAGRAERIQLGAQLRGDPELALVDDEVAGNRAATVRRRGTGRRRTGPAPASARSRSSAARDWRPRAPLRRAALERYERAGRGSTSRTCISELRCASVRQRTLSPQTSGEVRARTAAP